MREYRRIIGHARAWFAVVGRELSQATATDVAVYIETRPRTWASRNGTRAALRHYWASVGRQDPPLRALRRRRGGWSRSWTRSTTSSVAGRVTDQSDQWWYCPCGQFKDRPELVTAIGGIYHAHCSGWVGPVPPGRDERPPP